MRDRTKHMDDDPSSGLQGLFRRLTEISKNAGFRNQPPSFKLLAALPLELHAQREHVFARPFIQLVRQIPVARALGAHDTGVYCGDYSECHVEDNTIVGPRTSIVANYGASARVRGNHVDGNVRAIVNSELTP